MSYIATIGFFDGVHRGHQFLIRQLIDKANASDMRSMIVTFSEHPRALLEGVAPTLLLTQQEREQKLKRTGVQQIVEFQFPVIKDLTAFEFMQVLHTQCQVNHLLIGYDHRFGSDRLSRIADYQKAGDRAGIEVERIEQAPEGNISSTKIRRALLEGRLHEANDYLGYCYTLTGEVVHGKHIGTELGYPTANLHLPADKLVPYPGVYAATVNTQPAIVNIGTNPTFGEDNSTKVEVHIPHFNGTLYGQTIQAQLIEYIREEKKFDTPEELKHQIQSDIKKLR